MDDIRPNLKKQGMVASDLLALGERLGTTVKVLGDKKLLKKHEGISKGRAIAAQIALGHLHVYKSARFARTMKISTKSRPMPSRVLASESRKRGADIDTWEPWRRGSKRESFTRRTWMRFDRNSWTRGECRSVI